MLKLKKIFGMGNCGSNTEPEPVIGKLDAVSDIVGGMKGNRNRDKKERHSLKGLLFLLQLTHFTCKYWVKISDSRQKSHP